MADAGSFRSSFGLSGANRGRKKTSSASGNSFTIGAPVRVLDHWRSPLAGQSGRIIGITPGDPCGLYLVQFGNDLLFRYRENELVDLPA